MKLSYSFIIPVYNRPQEIKELLESFTQLEDQDDYEIVIVEDGSTQTSETICKSYSNQLAISYYKKENSGPGDSRNYGMKRANGNYYIILDSDCILPPHYLNTIDTYLAGEFVHCFGGADTDHQDFSHLQKAINYTMTSFFTTGGIRGSEKSISRFEPRSFNMGLSKEAFEQTGGFSKIHPGEDPDLSHRIIKAGFKTTFIPKAFVFHKRRISWNKFYTQVKKFGLVRPILNSWHPQSSKFVFWLPSVFVFSVIVLFLLSILLNKIFMLPVLLYMLLIFIDSTSKNKSLTIGFLSVVAMFIQFFGYGMSFFKSNFYINILKRDPEKQFPKLFFK